MKGFRFCGDAVDGAQELSQGGDEGGLGWLSGGSEALVEGSEPVASADDTEDGHPRRAAQAGVAEWSDAGAGRGSLSGLPEAGHHAHEGGEGGGALELGGIAGRGDDAGGGLRADAVHGGDELADVVTVDLVGDVAFEVGQAGATGRGPGRCGG